MRVSMDASTLILIIAVCLIVGGVLGRVIPWGRP